MHENYERTKLVITIFDKEDVIVTSSTTVPEDKIHVIYEGPGFDFEA